jgi:ribulose-5-phosphate 4-epimerase/fuculose-1-phosphate aldolase
MSRPANAAGFLIHSAVHRARPDVVAACHTHSVHGMAWSVFGRPIEMITQDAAYLYGDAQAVYRVCVCSWLLIHFILMMYRTLEVSSLLEKKVTKSALL